MKHNLLLGIFFFVTIFIVNVTCEIFKKSIILNEKQYDILGTRMSIENTELEYFARIPYAKPPVGSLRFKHPQEIEGDPWIGTYNATVQPNTCWQAEAGDFDKLNPAAKLWLSKTPMNEDCLYLTIWSPKSVATKLPVMLWIYGGAFLSGSSTLEVYDGSVLASKYGVVVVSVQYRLGPLGFLYLDKNDAPGNQGLLDQWMAIKWVKKNIHNFNGDGDSITLFGESAGSISISLHVLSPLSRNLMKRAILESASALSTIGIESKRDAEERTLEFAKYFDCNNNQNIVECLRNVHPENLVTKQFNLKTFVTKQRSDLLKARGFRNLFTDGSYFLDIFFKPIYDHHFITKSVDELIREANYKTKTELLLGYNANEGMYFLIYGLNTWLKFINNATIDNPTVLSSTGPDSMEASRFLLENLISNEYARRNFIPLLMHEYNIPSNLLGWQKWNSTQVLLAFDQLTGDQNFVCPVVDYAERIGARGRKIYMYSFQHRTDRTTFPKWTGAMHGYEIEYVFGMPFSEKFTQSYYSFSSNEKKLSEYVMKMWSNFAKYGNPTNEEMEYFNEMVSWPTYNTTDKLTFFFTTPDDSMERPVRINEKIRQCRFWKHVLPSIMPMLSSAENLIPSKLIIFWLILQMIWISSQ